MKNEPKYPKSAQALLVAMQTPTPRGFTGIPVLVWGRPGEGKSSFIEQLERPDFPVVTLIASIHDPTDFSGLPVFENGKVRYAAPSWVEAFEQTGQGILFLDELTTAAPSVQAALLRVVLERKVGFHSLPAGVRIIAAANPPDLMTGGWELSPPLLNRFLHLHWGLSAEVYLEALANGFAVAQLPEIDTVLHKSAVFAWKIKVNAFLKRMPGLLSVMPVDGAYAYPTPRSWDYAISLMASCDLLGLSPSQGKSVSVFMDLLGGTVGDSTSLMFLEFVRNLKLPDPEEVLDGKVTVDVSAFNDSEIFVLFGTLNAAIAKRYSSVKLPASAIRYFEIALEVFVLGKRDLIYVSLKQAASNGLLGATVSVASKNKDPKVRTEALAMIGKVFEDPTLSQFIELLEPTQ